MKTQKHLPIFGVGPIYVFIIAVLTFAAYLTRNLPALSSGRIDVLQKPLLILGIILIVLGVFIWFQGAVVSRLLDGIVQNRLVTTGIYACPAVTRAPPPAFPRNPRGRLGFPGPTQGEG